MGNEQPLVSFADIIQLIGGGTPKTSVKEYWGGDIPWLTVSDFNTGYRWVDSAEKKITVLGLSSSATKMLNRGDIIISARGTVGVIAQLAKPMAFNQSCYGIRGIKGISENDYIYYALKNTISQIRQVSYGGVFDTVTRNTFRIIKTRLPDIREQKAIASILGTLDDKIELNRRMCKTLEDMAQAIFKSWFVDFDPVHAKVAGKEPEGMKAEIASLFPDSFVDSELGKIPKGWIVEPIGEMIKIYGGGTPSTKEPRFWVDGVHYFCTPKDMANLSVPILLSTSRKLSDEGVKKISSGILPIDSVLLSSRAPIGYLAVSKIPISVNQGINAMVCNEKYPYLYALHWTRSNLDVIKSKANGSTFLEISKSSFRTINTIVPSAIVLDSFMRLLEPFYNKIETLLAENQLLGTMRDYLLPKLISGEIRTGMVKEHLGSLEDVNEQSFI